MLEIEEGVSGYGESFLARWYTEAAGMKVRYVPAGIPDLLRTDALVDYEARTNERHPLAQAAEVRGRIDYNRKPETDMEACMPRHTLEIFAKGLGIWADFPARDRKAQLLHIGRSLSDFSPVPFRRPPALLRTLHDLRQFSGRHLCRRHVSGLECFRTDHNANPAF
jgi:hypothetical protein